MRPAVLNPDGSRTHHLDFPAAPGPVSLDQLTDADRGYLRELGRGRGLVIDVGTFIGGSAEALLEGMAGCGRLVTIDTFCGTPGGVTADMPRWQMIRYATERLARFEPRVTIVVGESVTTAALFPRGSADLVFIDAAHDYPNVLADLRAWAPVVKLDGLIAGHDLDRMAKRQPNREDYETRGHEDFDDEIGMHIGVARALYETFEHVSITEDQESSIWHAKPQWVRA